MTKFDEKAIATAIETVSANIDERKKFELKKKSDNESIQKSLTVMQNKQVNAATCLFLLKNDIDLNFMNTQKIKSSCMNEKACVKVFDLVDHINIDKYSRHILLTMRALEENNQFLNRFLSKECLRIKSEAKLKNTVFEHVRFDEIKAEDTISTQANSSLRALECAKLVRIEKDENRKDIYKLNKSNAHLKKLFAAFDKQMQNAA